MLNIFAESIRELQQTYRAAFAPYRPELYYMRGPGPACRAKRACGETLSAAESTSALVTLAEAHS
jgi:hypothetical protein